MLRQIQQELRPSLALHISNPMAASDFLAADITNAGALLQNGTRTERSIETTTPTILHVHKV